jgi:hypothetical protein
MMAQKILANRNVGHVILLILVMVMLVSCQSQPSGIDDVEPETEEMVQVEATATAVAVPTTPPEPTEKPAITAITSSDKMAGIWLGTIAGETGYVMYTPDGQFTVSLTKDNLVTAPRVRGEYWFAEGQIHLRDLENSGHWTACDEATVGVYQVVQKASDKVTFQTVEDTCNEGGFTRQYLFANMVQERIGDALPLEQAGEVPDAE